MREFIEIVNYCFLAFFVLLNGSYLVMSVIAIRTLVRYARKMRLLSIRQQIAAASAPPIAIIAPMYNEAAVCVDSARSLLGIDYPNYEVMLINDGSTDDTVERVVDAFEMDKVERAATAQLDSQRVRGIYRSRTHRQLWLIDKENGGKADALNAGINYCRAPLFCAIDADTLLERDGLLRVVQPFLEDSRTVAAGGIVRIANDCTVGHGQVVDVRLPENELARLQVTEYLRAFLSGRVAWDVTGMVLIISGAFGLFKRSLVVDVGGYSTDTVGEDMELVVRIHRHCLENKIPYKVRFVPDPVAWTECPESMSVLGRQRDRWQRGLAQVMVRHIKMLFNPRYGRVGMIAYPYFFFFEMLGPVMETIGYVVIALSIIFGMISPTIALAFFAVAIVFGVALSSAAVTLEELSFHKYTRLSDLLRLFRVSITENLGYRQLNAYWRMKGLYSYLKGDHSWGEMTRTGFAIGGGKS